MTTKQEAIKGYNTRELMDYLEFEFLMRRHTTYRRDIIVISILGGIPHVHTFIGS